MEGKVAVLGSADFVMPFSALGLDTFAVELTTEQVQETARAILKQHYTLIVVAENVARQAQPVFDATLRKAIPCVVVVPFTAEPTGIATESLGRLIKLAAGINILQN
ncbi:MAG TPA: V-type ATP synthase subunit F [Anaerohalosphaeraceae bacterium]|jgi:vacuolar-type H+-ATPase subunit F/Vma7|nr:V-type ATP synthase subunit F [Anaerohalosphaeraceae bacterium]HOT73699.1 V-type ATP synthase subunit F [Anaerohalosphaeraceae bacterium]HPB93548.1 V-type ATP synthase subunit F [Anaerohalosphaeraceae bacterium]HQG05054.1 V-type ATP synthase subunit F [Anaerohalosphaeraceae bacterium]HQI08200.1 V-type ATP synthase subunit F [Anaerohalosphaeraceae bacterium]